MQFLHFYTRKNQVIIPTVARTEDGFFLDTEPVAVIGITRADSLREAFRTLLSQENPEIPTPAEAGSGERGQSVVLEKIGLRRWDAFERESILYTLYASGDRVHFFSAGRGADGMWTSTRQNELTFPAATPAALIAAAVVERISAETEKIEPSRTPLLLAPPPDADR